MLLLGTACRATPGRVTLALLGDINLGRGVSPTADSLAYLAPELRRADLALANLESPLAPYVRSGAATVSYNLCAPAERAPLLAAWGLDLLSLANNHDRDCGPDGLAQTGAALQASGLTPLLPNADPVYLTIHGLRLAFLAFDDVSAPLDADAAAQSIRNAGAGGALVIVAVHWGLEYQGGEDDRQVILARRFAGAGAALIWGTHPHVLQPAEWLKAGGRRTLVLYSLGNALFDQQGLADTRRSALILATLGADGVQSVRAVPFAINVAASRVISADTASTASVRERLHLP